ITFDFIVTNRIVDLVGENVDVSLRIGPLEDSGLVSRKIVDLTRVVLDVSSAEALKRALLAAKTVGHAAPAGGSITAAHIMRVFERLGIAAQLTPKVRLAAGGPNGRVSVLVSSGEAEIGLQQLSELMSNPDVEVIGMLPAELQLITLYSAGVTASAREAAA